MPTLLGGFSSDKPHIFVSLSLRPEEGNSRLEAMEVVALKGQVMFFPSIKHLSQETFNFERNPIRDNCLNLVILEPYLLQYYLSQPASLSKTSLKYI